MLASALANYDLDQRLADAKKDLNRTLDNFVPKVQNTILRLSLLHKQQLMSQPRSTPNGEGSQQRTSVAHSMGAHTSASSVPSSRGESGTGRQRSASIGMHCPHRHHQHDNNNNTITDNNSNNNTDNNNPNKLSNSKSKLNNTETNISNSKPIHSGSGSSASSSSSPPSEEIIKQASFDDIDGFGTSNSIPLPKKRSSSVNVGGRGSSGTSARNGGEGHGIPVAGGGTRNALLDSESLGTSAPQSYYNSFTTHVRLQTEEIQNRLAQQTDAEKALSTQIRILMRVRSIATELRSMNVEELKQGNRCEKLVQQLKSLMPSESETDSMRLLESGPRMEEEYVRKLLTYVEPCAQLVSYIEQQQ